MSGNVRLSVSGDYEWRRKFKVECERQCEVECERKCEVDAQGYVDEGGESPRGLA